MIDDSTTLWQRSTGYVTIGDLGQRCDRTIKQGWYRFKSPAGSEMPTSCPITNACGNVFYESYIIFFYQY